MHQRLRIAAGELEGGVGGRGHRRVGQQTSAQRVLGRTRLELFVGIRQAMAGHDRLHRFGQDVGKIVPEQLERVGRLPVGDAVDYLLQHAA